MHASPFKTPALSVPCYCPIRSDALNANRSMLMRSFAVRFHPLTKIGGMSVAPSVGIPRRCVTVCAKKRNKKKDDGPYKSTVTLPETEFSLRANSLQREPEIQKFWEDSKIYEQLLENNSAGSFTLHDGPPYANGDLHMGHALNKILKDFINRYQLLRGKKAKFVPGWDTHGLPIELKVLQSIPREEQRTLTPLELRQRAKNFAETTVDAQREQFQRYGVWADWNDPYLTLKPEYEAAQLGVFADMVEQGHIYRGRKPVHWSPSSQTALAEAELEYPEGHTSRSCFVAFPIENGGDLLNGTSGGSLAIWTTTPWTIPANRAVAVNPDLDYALVEVSGGDGEQGVQNIIIAQELMESLEEKFEMGFKLLSSFKGKEMEGMSYRHPLFPDRVQPVVLGGDYITTETGTGLVHTAPGHGQEDFIVGMKYGLEIFSPVDAVGKFTKEADRFEGLKVLNEGNKAVLVELEELKMLLKEEPYQHKYPYDWRTKKPIIFRATDQWFASVDGFRDEALNAIKNVQWIPAVGENRIRAMTESRSDWCISRQRRWGVPIPAFYDNETGDPLMTPETIRHVQGIIAEKGTDAWWELAIEELLPEQLKDQAGRLRKGEDTMDVWFDSGTSWAAVLGNNSGLNYPASLYLEGSDQHRGWFQSSLLTSVATNGKAPYERVLTHGFVLDEKSRKMSKSLGNVVDPRMIIEGGKNQKQQPAYGADVLRLWVASVDYTSDVMIGGGILKQTAEVYRKIRGTIRFLLGNVCDYDPDTNKVPYEQLPSIDRYILYKLSLVMKEAEDAYEGFQFSRLFGLLQNFVVADLSNFYLDVAKDRLYIAAKNSFSRRSCQTVMNEILFGMLSAVCPVLPHLGEDAWINLPISRPEKSIFFSGWFTPPPEWTDKFTSEENESWEAVFGVREFANKALEMARSEKVIGASLDAKVQIYVENDEKLRSVVCYTGNENGVDDMRYVCITSGAEKVSKEVAESCPYFNGGEVEGLGEVVVGVTNADGKKCGRCWNYSVNVGESQEHPELCERCTPVIEEMGFKPPPREQEALAEANV